METETAPDQPKSGEDLPREIIGLLQDIKQDRKDVLNHLIDVERAARHG